MELLTLNTEAEFKNFDDIARMNNDIEYQTYVGGLKLDKKSWHWIDSGDEMKTIKWQRGKPRFSLDVNNCTYIARSKGHLTLQNVSCRSEKHNFKFVCQTTEKLC